MYDKGHRQRGNRGRGHRNRGRGHTRVGGAPISFSAQQPPLICRITGKIKLTASAAFRQVRHTSRAVKAARCTACGTWHVCSPTYTDRQKQRDRERLRHLPVDMDDGWADQ